MMQRRRSTRLLADFLTRAELAGELNRTVQSLQRWERKHEGPAVTRVGCAPYYNRATVMSWLADQAAKGFPDLPPKDEDSSNGDRA